MFTSLLLLPAWIKTAIIAGLLLGAMQFQHWWQIRGLRSQIAKIEVALDKEKLANAELRQGLVEVQANRDQLRSTIQSQNAAIALWQSKARTAEAKAATNALRIVKTGSQVAATLRNTAGSLGPEGLNSWLATRFSAQ